jgi:(1->4)-alpha-D-glucan 1-alpha-D-glucosylmutase
MIKAMREAKLRTSWTNPNQAHESAVTEFVAAILGDDMFFNRFQPFARRISDCGMLNSLSQTLLKIAAPGVPDTYQGTELWDLSLVDPDNRRPVDYAARAAFLGELNASKDRHAMIKSLLQTPSDGRLKLFVTRQALHARRQSSVFATGDYIPGIVEGRYRERIFAFARRVTDSWAVCIVPRVCSYLIRDRVLPVGVIWAATQVIIPDLPPHLRLRNIFTDETIEASSAIPVAAALETFPVCLMISTP